MALASARVVATGFSHNTCSPLSRAHNVVARWTPVGVHTSTKSMGANAVQRRAITNHGDVRVVLCAGGWIDGDDDLQPVPQPGIQARAGKVGVARNAAKPDQCTAIHVAGHPHRMNRSAARRGRRRARDGITHRRWREREPPEWRTGYDPRHGARCRRPVPVREGARATPRSSAQG